MDPNDPAKRLTILLAAILGLLLAGTPSTIAAPDEPVIRDPEGDVMLEGLAPLAAGGDWADILALWYGPATETELIMQIELLEAAEIPPPGEVAAHIEVNGTHYLAGFTTVLPPIASGIHQGGFYCTANAQGKVEPSDCFTLPNVTLSSNILRVPLPRALFDLQEGNAIETHTAYSGAWYLDVQTRFDETDRGKSYTVPPTQRATEGEADGADPNTQDQRPGTAQDAPRTGDTPSETGEARAASLGSAVLALFAMLMSVRERHVRRDVPVQTAATTSSG